MLGNKRRADEAGRSESLPQSPVKKAAQLLSVSGEFARIEGKFEVRESLEVECEIGGEMKVDGRLVIGERGVIHADVRTVDAVIRGTYEGNMVATGDVEIAPTGRVTGNIQTDSLVIHKGGIFNGNVTRMDDEAPKGIVQLVDERAAPEGAPEPQRAPAYQGRS